jgi:hypothetical protein
MQKHVYEYAVIRVVPRVEREEFVNAGIVLFSKSARFLKTRLLVSEQKVLCLDPETDCAQLREHMESFEKIAAGAKNGGPIAMEDKPERFRWLTARRSSIIQTSRPHPGMTDDLDAELEKLFGEYVL